MAHGHGRGHRPPRFPPSRSPQCLLSAGLHYLLYYYYGKLHGRHAGFLPAGEPPRTTTAVLGFGELGKKAWGNFHRQANEP